METVGVGIIGVGGMGAHHAAVLDALAGVSVRAIADPDGPNASAVSARTGARSDTDPFALIVAPDVDAVVVASPDETHADYTIAAVQHGVPTL